MGNILKEKECRAGMKAFVCSSTFSVPVFQSHFSFHLWIHWAYTYLCYSHLRAYTLSVPSTWSAYPSNPCMAGSSLFYSGWRALEDQQVTKTLMMYFLTTLLKANFDIGNIYQCMETFLLVTALVNVSATSKWWVGVKNAA